MAIASSQCDSDETTVASPWWAGAPVGPMEGWRGGRRRHGGATQPRWEPDFEGALGGDGRHQRRL